MAKLPDPPALDELRALVPDLKVVPAGTSLARIYFASSSHPLPWNGFRYFGPVRGSRFDHHLLDAGGAPCLQDRGIYYAAPQGMTCLAEVFQHARVIDRVRDDPYLCIFETTRDLHLLDLTGEFPTRMGASLAIHSGPRDRTRRWAVALYEAYDLDGIHYTSSMHPGAPAIALNERAVDAVPALPSFNRPLSDPSLTDIIDACTQRLGYLKG